MKKAIVIGASSGIGKALAFLLAAKNYEVGLMARRTELLHAIAEEIPTKTYVSYLDISKTSEAIQQLEELLTKMGKVDLIIINSGVGFLNPELLWEKEKEILDVNVNGFCALAGVSYHYFKTQGYGHLVGISSIAALKGLDTAPAYSASKAFISNYLEGLIKKAFKENLPLVITDIKPGYVDTDLAKGAKKFWTASPEKAAEQIYNAIDLKKNHAYITKRWRLIGWLLKVLPNCIYNRI